MAEGQLVVPRQCGSHDKHSGFWCHLGTWIYRLEEGEMEKRGAERRKGSGRTGRK